MSIPENVTRWSAVKGALGGVHWTRSDPPPRARSPRVCYSKERRFPSSWKEQRALGSLPTARKCSCPPEGLLGGILAVVQGRDPLAQGVPTTKQVVLPLVL